MSPVTDLIANTRRAELLQELIRQEQAALHATRRDITHVRERFQHENEYCLSLQAQLDDPRTHAWHREAIRVRHLPLAQEAKQGTWGELSMLGNQEHGQALRLSQYREDLRALEGDRRVLAVA